LDNKLDEELFARQKKQTERFLKIIVALLAAVFAYVLYFLLKNG